MRSEDSPKAIVRDGWNRISRVYRSDDATSDALGHSFEEYEEWLAPLFELLPLGTRILDLGCGCGVPTDRLLARRFQVTGVDISDTQIDRARRLVPEAEFIRNDMARIAFPPGSFGAVVSLYAVIHVPRVEQRGLLTNIHTWLRRDGLLLMIAGRTAWTGIQENWLGIRSKMYWSHPGADTYARWLKAIGFEVIRRAFVPEGDGGHELFFARKVTAERMSLGGGERESARRPPSDGPAPEL